MRSVTAAHPTWPLPSYVRVTNVTNGRSMIVRLNDRGPFHSDRIMDVSSRVADALDFKRMGTANIKVDYIKPAGLTGSDDQFLMATLRDDGKPATFDGAPQGSPVMVADMEEKPAREEKTSVVASLFSRAEEPKPVAQRSATPVQNAADALEEIDEEDLACKVSAISAYKSQVFRNPHYEEFIRGLAVQRGCQVGFRFAEAYEVIRWVAH
jgi:rare lipoprotein A